jgi:hypothetical protein
LPLILTITTPTIRVHNTTAAVEHIIAIWAVEGDDFLVVLVEVSCAKDKDLNNQHPFHICQEHWTGRN